MTWTLAGIEGIIRSSWGPDTLPPDERNPVWDPANPPRGQCGVTALVVHDLLGGLEVDLTRDQFGPEEVVTAGMTLARPTTAMKRGRDEYETLRRRVFEALGRDGSIPPADGNSH